MGFNCGIVGLPNVGKSTLFNALTAAQIDAANYPFCTIEPNVGIVPVPDLRLTSLAEIATSKKIIPTTMEFIDIAGLVKGAASGEGLGNKFLSHIRETDAIAHVVRCFENPDITHVHGKIDPIDDADIIETELALADLETIEKAINKLTKQLKAGDKEAKVLHDLLSKLKEHLDNGKYLRTFEFVNDEKKLIKHYGLLTLKPLLYIANTDEQGLHGNDFINKLQDKAKVEGAPVIVICAAIEAELATMEVDEKKEYLEALNLPCSGLDLLIRAGYELLNLQTFFTIGPKEAHAWTIPRNTLAPAAAGKIHTDFEKGFIKAEVISYNDFITYNGEQGAKEAGKLRLEGKNYIMQDGDVIHFRFNV